MLFLFPANTITFKTRKWEGAPSQQLEDASPAYAAYKTLDRLPRNAPPFSRDLSGFPVINDLERYCRMPTIADGILCGRVCDDKKDLIEHSKDFHGLVQAKRPIFRVFYTKTDLKTDSKFYELLMKDEDYGRRKKKKTPPKTAKSLQSTCSAPPGNNEDDVDDEEPPLKYENFGDAPNAEKTTRGGDVRTSDGAKPASSGRDKAEIPIQRDGGNANKETDVSSAAHAAVAMVGDKEKDEESLEMQRKKGECDLRVCSKAGYIEAEGVRGRDASSGD